MCHSGFQNLIQTGSNSSSQNFVASIPQDTHFIFIRLVNYHPQRPLLASWSLVSVSLAYIVLYHLDYPPPSNQVILYKSHIAFQIPLKYISIALWEIEYTCSNRALVSIAREQKAQNNLEVLAFSWCLGDKNWSLAPIINEEIQETIQTLTWIQTSLRDIPEVDLYLQSVDRSEVTSIPNQTEMIYPPTAARRQKGFYVEEDKLSYSFYKFSLKQNSVSNHHAQQNSYKRRHRQQKQTHK